ncbi:MAG: single-stranded DNA-binding protein [Magnetococcales bacterium]|nr:single-stranded DNA-binding protein [Magnetococcales bacterium]
MSGLGGPESGLANQIILQGVVIQPAEFRFTPSGSEVALLVVEHISQKDQSAPIQHLELRMPIVALGDLAQKCHEITVGQNIRVEGSLNQKRWIRDGKVRWGKIELFANTIQLLDERPTDINN